MIKTVPAPKGALISDMYEVYIKSEGKEEKADVYISLCPDGAAVTCTTLPPELQEEFNGLDDGSTLKKTYFAGFDCDSETEVRVVYKNNVSSFSIKPETLNKEIVTSQNSVSFKLKPGEFIAVEPDNDIFGSLHLFCNNISVPENTKKNFIEFKKGYYTVDNCEYIKLDAHGTPCIDDIPDDTVVYLHDGAVVCAALILNNKHNVKICGRGVLSLVERCYGADRNFDVDPIWGGFRYFALPTIYVKSGSSNIEIEGITINSEFRSIILRNCENIKICGVKMFSSCENADGVNIVNGQKILVKDCYIQSGDDSFAVFTSCDSIPTLADEEYPNPTGVSSDIELCGCILYTNCRIFMVGGHATGSTSPRNVVENINIHDNVVLHIASMLHSKDIEHRLYWSGILRVLSQSEQLVRNIQFKDITAEWTEGFTGKAIHIEIRDNSSASYTETHGYRIENISFENIHFTNVPENPMKSVLLSDFEADSVPDDYGIHNISLKNVTYDGKPVKANEDFFVLKGNVTGFTG